jgi:hypothetical protein
VDITSNTFYRCAETFRTHCTFEIIRANISTFPTAAESTQQFRQPTISTDSRFSFKPFVTIPVAQITTGIITVIMHCEPCQLSRCSYSLRAGRSEDRIPVAARFSPPVQTELGAHPGTCTMSTGSFSNSHSRKSLQSDNNNRYFT